MIYLYFFGRDSSKERPAVLDQVRLLEKRYYFVEAFLADAQAIEFIRVGYRLDGGDGSWKYSWADMAPQVLTARE